VIYIVIESNNLRQYFEDEKGKLDSMKVEDCGLKFDNEYVLNRKHKETVYLAEVADVKKAQVYIDKMNVVIKDSVESFNEDLDKYFEETYQFWSENIAGSDIIAKVNIGTLDLSEIKSEWTQTERMKWFYDNGITGIKTNNKPRYR